MANIYFRWIGCVLLVIGFSHQCMGATNEQYFVKPISNLLASVPFTITNRRPPQQRSFPYIGKTDNGYLLVYEESKTNRCIVLLPFTDGMRNRTATVERNEITTESGQGVQFMPGFVLLKKDTLYRALTTG